MKGRVKPTHGKPKKKKNMDYGFASTTAAITSQLQTNLPLVLAIFAGLTAVGIAVHYIRKWVGRK